MPWVLSKASRGAKTFVNTLGTEDRAEEQYNNMDIFFAAIAKCQKC